MKLTEIQDVVRDLVGNRELEPHILTFFIGSGRREVEKRGNFYWMLATPKEFTLTVDAPSYSISSDIGLTSYKKDHFLFVREKAGVEWWPVGVKSLSELQGQYRTSDTGMPDQAAIYNDALYVFPPKPNKDYLLKIWYFAWTDNPAVTAEDEVTKRWPEALIWASTAAGVRFQTKNEQLAAPYEAQLEREIAKIAEYSAERLRLPEIERRVLGAKG